MVTTTFTIIGEQIECTARLSNNRPVFDLFMNGEQIAEEIEYKDLLGLCESVRAELEEIASYWQDAGKQIADFHRKWSAKEEKQDD